MKELEHKGAKLERVLASQSIKDILTLAKRQAAAVGSTFVDSGFLLWAIAKKNQKVERVFSDLGITCQDILADIKPVGLSRKVKLLEVEQTDLCQLVLVKAFDVAADYKSRKINALHLLWVLTQTEEGLARGSLTRLGVNINELRNQVSCLIRLDSVSNSSDN